MTSIDAVILIALGGFVLSGLWFGLIHMVGSLVGFVFGAFVAAHGYDFAARIAAPWVGNNLNLARILAFFALFVIVNRLIGLLFHFVEKAFNFISVIPFLKTFNRLLGAGLGFLEGAIVLGLVVYFASRFPVSAAFTAGLQGSPLAYALNLLGSLLAPILPTAIQMLQPVI